MSTYQDWQRITKRFEYATGEMNGENGKLRKKLIFPIIITFAGMAAARITAILVVIKAVLITGIPQCGMFPLMFSIGLWVLGR